MNRRSPHFPVVTVLCFVLFSAGQQAPSKLSEAHAHLQRAEAALRSNDMDRASGEFRAVLASDPRNVEANANLGVIAFGKGEFRVASENFRKALAVQPSLTKAGALLGICEKRLHDPSAQKLLEKSFAKLTDPQLRTQVGLELAELYERNGDLEHTASVMGTLVGVNPESPDILYYAQRTYSELADDTLNKLAIVAPGSARMQQVIAERLVNAGDLKAAAEHYRKALELDPRLPGVRYELSEAILESAPADSTVQAQAEQELEKERQTEGDSSKVESELGRIAEVRSDSDQAAAHYQRAFAMDSGDVRAALGLGRSLMNKQKPEEAIKYLRRAAQVDPLNTEAHYRLALACKRVQQTEEAEKEMKLYQEIRSTKDRVKALYRQMNRAPRPEDDQASDLPK